MKGVRDPVQLNTVWPQYSTSHDKDRRIQGSRCPAAPRHGSESGPGFRRFSCFLILTRSTELPVGAFGGVCVILFMQGEVGCKRMESWDSASSQLRLWELLSCLLGGWIRLRVEGSPEPAFLQYGSGTGGTASSPHLSLCWQRLKIACDLLPTS